MDLETKARIITEFVTENVNEPLAEDFFEYNDLGIPLSVAFNANLCTLTEQGIEIINETYNNVCLEMEVSSDKEYNDISDLHDEYRRLQDEEE